MAFDEQRRLELGNGPDSVPDHSFCEDALEEFDSAWAGTSLVAPKTSEMGQWEWLSLEMLRHFVLWRIACRPARKNGTEPGALDPAKYRNLEFSDLQAGLRLRENFEIEL